MGTKSKKVRGKLFNLSSNDALAEIVVEISLITQNNSAGKPNYLVSATTENYRPDLNDRSLKLELADQIVGEVFVTINGIPSDKTNYKIILQDEIWNNLDWFISL